MVPAPAPDTPEAVDAVVATAATAVEPMAAVPPATRASWLAAIAGEAMAGAGVTTGPFGIVHGFDAGTRLMRHPALRAGRGERVANRRRARLGAAARRVPRRVDGVAE